MLGWRHIHLGEKAQGVRVIAKHHLYWKDQYKPKEGLFVINTHLGISIRIVCLGKGLQEESAFKGP